MAGARFGAYYLDGSRAALAAVSGNESVDVIPKGNGAFDSWKGNFRFETDVLANTPDLVLFEFSHNDEDNVALALIADSAHAMLERLWTARPDCDVAFVHLAPPGSVRGGSTKAMTAWEEIADRLSLPSVDVASFMENLVDSGIANWAADAPGALTIDGTHHSAAVATLVGQPFGDALAQLVAMSRFGPLHPRPSVPASPYSRVARLAPEDRAHAHNGAWLMAIPVGEFSAERDSAFDGAVAVALESGASFAVRFRGTRIGVWLGTIPTRCQIRIDDSLTTLTVNWKVGRLQFVWLGPVLAFGEHLLTITLVDQVAIFGDVYVVGDVL
jgi:hypothetical protein